MNQNGCGSTVVGTDCNPNLHSDTPTLQSLHTRAAPQPFMILMLIFRDFSNRNRES